MQGKILEANVHEVGLEVNLSRRLKYRKSTKLKNGPMYSSDRDPDPSHDFLKSQMYERNIS